MHRSTPPACDHTRNRLNRSQRFRELGGPWHLDRELHLRDALSTQCLDGSHIDAIPGKDFGNITQQALPIGGAQDEVCLLYTTDASDE